MHNYIALSNAFVMFFPQDRLKEWLIGFFAVLEIMLDLTKIRTFIFETHTYIWLEAMKN